MPITDIAETNTEPAGDTLKPGAPRSVSIPLDEAVAQAIDQSEPLFVPVTIYADDRGWSVMNQFQGVLTPRGQINYSLVYPGVIKAWHRHHKQTDLWMCLMGHIKVGIYRDDGAAWQLVTGEKRPGITIIPPPLWHGMTTVGPTPAGLLYYVTHAYNPQAPDEDRRAYDSVTGFPWQVQHR